MENVVNSQKSKKFLVMNAILTVIVLLFSAVFITFFCLTNSKEQSNINTDINTKFNLANIIKNKDLKTVYANGDIIQPDEIKTFAKFHNNEHEIMWDKIDVSPNSFSQNQATLISNDYDFYFGSVDVFYEVDKVRDIKSFFNYQDTINVGKIYLNADYETKELQNKLTKIIKSRETKIDIKHIKITIPSRDKNLALLFGEFKYSGSIEIRFEISIDVPDLSEILTKTDLGQIIFDEEPSEETIKHKIKELNPEINIDVILIQFDKVSNFAYVIGNDVDYQGSVKVIFDGIIKLNIVNDFPIINLGEIEIQESEAQANMFEIVINYHIYELYEKHKIKSEIISRIERIAEIKNSSELTQESRFVTFKGKPLEKVIHNPKMIKTIYVNEVTLSFRFKITN